MYLYLLKRNYFRWLRNLSLNDLVYSPLFKAHNQTTDKEIPEPFISSDNIESEIAEEKYHTIPELKNNKAELSEEESENKWKKWDEG